MNSKNFDLSNKNKMHNKAMLHLLVSALFIGTVQAGCPLWSTSNQTSDSRLPGDGGYRIIISGNYDKYIPKAVYTISLQGQSIYTKPKEFSRFTLSVDSEHVPFSSTANVGFFQIFSDSLVQFNENCINTVSELSYHSKSEVRVLWRAPPPGSGCVIFTAMVMDNLTEWFAEEGNLVKTFCEMNVNETEQLNNLHCCACDEAKYKMVLEGLWSKATHPKDYPESLWLTHFSDVVGASHETNFSFWGRDHIATDGFRQLAEWGSTAGLEGELRSNAKYLRTYIKAPGLWYPRVNNKTSANFNVDRKHPVLSVASMFGPSPDWIVGVSKLNLCQSNCSWIKDLEIDLYPWDAGTDNGITYMSHNSETRPREYMKLITTMYPEDPRSPFYDPSGKPMQPIAKLYLNREEIKKSNCNDEDLEKIVAEFNMVENIDNIEKPECMTTEYSQWTKCSVSCGKGLRMRTRAYRIPEKANMMGCTRQLISKEMCLADKKVYKSRFFDFDENPFLDFDEKECAMSEWTKWSRCDPFCYVSDKVRRRKLLNIKNRKKCIHLKLFEKIRCDCFVSVQNETEICKTTEWSDWSPCTKTCGSGFQSRSRLLLTLIEDRQACLNKVKLFEQRPCLNQYDCNLYFHTTKAICSEKLNQGPCRGYFEKWYFDSKHLVCLPFIYGGCRGNKNNFSTYEECKKICGNVLSQMSNNESVPTTENPLSININCELSNWSDWSPCSVTCGIGQYTSSRYIKKIPQNDGTSCPKHLQRYTRCQLAPCE
ncbi:PREDICTED: spondin-1 [Ceratosolen solmsi marchali]|uniref:Spondin-1 n=1 Tax=Ceratosolen solmsi marchali TaxID=326594 RepID=A0AAJ7E0W3_9HYME|nr:PREDICTED: spondin-1 [Ceratosolen solmsi marchali]